MFLPGDGRPLLSRSVPSGVRHLLAVVRRHHQNAAPGQLQAVSDPARDSAAGEGWRLYRGVLEKPHPRLRVDLVQNLHPSDQRTDTAMFALQTVRQAALLLSDGCAGSGQRRARAEAAEGAPAPAGHHLLQHDARGDDQEESVRVGSAAPPLEAVGDGSVHALQRQDNGRPARGNGQPVLDNVSGDAARCPDEGRFRGRCRPPTVPARRCDLRRVRFRWRLEVRDGRLYHRGGASASVEGTAGVPAAGPLPRRDAYGRGARVTTVPGAVRRQLPGAQLRDGTHQRPGAPRAGEGSRAAERCQLPALPKVSNIHPRLYQVPRDVLGALSEHRHQGQAALGGASAARAHPAPGAHVLHRVHVPRARVPLPPVAGVQLEVRQLLLRLPRGAHQATARRLDARAHVEQLMAPQSTP